MDTTDMGAKLAAQLQVKEEIMASSSSGDNNDAHASNTMSNSTKRKGGMDLFDTISSFCLMDETDTDAKLAAQLQVKEEIMASSSSSGDDNDAHA
eukprot:8567941-Ditylum_brightwellii.AAC.1